MAVKAENATGTTDEGRRLDTDRLAEHAPLLYQIARSMRLGHQDAEDLVQETFEKVLRRPRFLDPRATEVSYLITCLRHAYTTRLRSTRGPTRPPTVLLSEEAVDFFFENIEDRSGERPGSRMERNDLVERIKECLDGDLLLAVYAFGLTHSEVARQFGITHQVLHQRIHQARKRCAALLTYDGPIPHRSQARRRSPAPRLPVEAQHAPRAGDGA